MALKKNLTAKLIALAATIATVLGAWLLVRSHPPASTSAETATPDAAQSAPRTSAQSGTSSSHRIRPASPGYTRTHVS